MFTSLAFVALLLAEVLYLTLTLDTQHLERVPSVWATLVGGAPQYLRLTTTIALATMALGGRSLWVTWRSEMNREKRSHQARAAFLAGHVGLLILFARVSSVFFAGQGAPVRAPGVFAIAWILTGSLALFCWSHALLPWRRWVTVLRAHGSSVACGSAVGVVAWIFGFVSEAFWQPLARYTFRIVGAALGLIYPEIVSDPTALILGTPAFAVQIAPQCSGYEGIGLIVGFLSIYLFFFRKELRFPGALLLLPLGIVTMWVLNLARLVALIAIGSAGWQDVALGGFHSQAGWLVFNAVGLGFVALTQKGRYFRTYVEEPHRQRLADSTSPYLAPFLVLLAVAMVTGAVSAGFDWLYPVRLVVLIGVLWSFRRHYATLNWRASWAGVACGIAAFSIWMVLLPEGVNGKANWPDALRSVGSVSAAMWLVARTAGYVVAVPVAEELVFRGYLTRRFWRSDQDAASLGTFTAGGLFLSSAVFGAFHGQLWLAGTLAGMLFAFALYRRRSMGDAVLAHATTNGLIATYVFVTGQWSVWS